MSYTKNITTLSAELNTLSDSENQNRTELLERMLIDLKFDYVVAEGCYKGDTEISFIVKTPDVTTFNVLYSIAKNQFDQESVLYVDGDSNAMLMYSENFGMESIGVYSQVNPKRIEELDAYTIVDGSVYSVI